MSFTTSWRIHEKKILRSPSWTWRRCGTSTLILQELYNYSWAILLTLDSASFEQSYYY
jgi:hypothetical protein